MNDTVILDGYRGHVDAIEPVLSGWVSEIARPAVPVSLCLGIDGGRPIWLIAERPRPDVATFGLAEANCGFAVELPADCLDGGEHCLRLLLPDGRNLNLPGLPEPVALGPVRAELVPPQLATIAAVAELLRRTDHESGFDPELIRLEHASAFNAVRAPEQGFIFYAKANNRLVGYSRLDRGQGEVAALGAVRLTVLEAYRRKGLGEALLRALLDTAAANGMAQVWLSVRPDNTPAIRLYEKLGFRRKDSRLAGQWRVPGEDTMVWLSPGG